MYPTRPRRMLGLAIETAAIHIAQVQRIRAGLRLVRYAKLPVDPQQDWAAPQKLGQRLGACLRAQKFSAHHAMIGLTGRWVLFKPLELPPTSPTAAAGVLHLTIERQYQAAAKDWLFDYAGQPSSEQARTVLLGAVARSRITDVQTMAKAAGLHVDGITATTFSLTLTKPVAQTPEALVIHLANDGAQLVVRAGGRASRIERLVTTTAREAAAGGSPCESLGRQVQRVLAALPEQAARPDSIIMWDETAAGSAGERVVGDLGLDHTHTPSMHELGVLNGQTPAPTQAVCTPGSVALAIAGLNRAAPELDFLHSRLTVKPRRRVTRVQLLAAAAVAVMVLGGALLVRDWYVQKNAVAALRAEEAALAPHVKTARTELDQQGFTRGWFDRRPPLLDCQRALTLVFPSSGGVWATSLAVRDDLTGTLAGNARDERNVLALLDRMRSSASFADVKLLYLRQVTTQQGGVAFAMTFSYLDKG